MKYFLFSIFMLGIVPLFVSAETYQVEAESLVNQYGMTIGSKSLESMRVVTYSHASNKCSVYLKGNTLKWAVSVKENGTYYLYLRARCGYNDDKYRTAKPFSKYVAKIDSRTIELVMLRNTLDYYNDGENFVWFKSEPINLDAGKHEVEISSKWEWGHVDKIALSTGMTFPKGNVAIANQRAGKVFVWVGDVYQLPFPPNLEAPKKLSKDINLTAVRNATSYGAFFVRNDESTPGIVHLLIKVSKFKSSDGKIIPRESIKIYKIAWTGIRAGAPIAPDALAELNPLGAIDISPGITFGFWIFFDISENVAPGIYSGGINIENQHSLKSQHINVKLRISQITLPEKTDLAVFAWNYAFANPNWQNDLIEHGTTAARCSVNYSVKYRFDKNGNLVGDMDFSHLQPYVDFYKKTDGYILLYWWLKIKWRRGLRCEFPGAPSGADLPFLSAQWKKAFKTLVMKTVSYLTSQGVPKEKILQYPFDEYLGEEFIKVGKVFREMDSELKIFADYTAKLEVYKRAAPYVDVWCPASGEFMSGRMERDGRLAFLRSTGKPIWFYDCGYNQRAESPYWKYRLKFWWAYKFKLQGCCFWKHRGDRVGSVYYPMFNAYGDVPITSRRWEAWYSGLQDYKLLKLAERKFADNAEKLKQIKEFTKTACSDVNNTKLAEQMRTELIKLLEEKYKHEENKRNTKSN